MSEIHECLTVLCPFDQVPAAARTYVASLPAENGKSIIALRVPIGDLIVERRADLTITYVDGYAGYEIMTIEWRPHDGGPYPVFHGRLSVEEGVGNYCRLDLDGDYAPPLGLAGVVFDAVVGHRIAVEAARALLDEIRIGVELAFTTGMTVA